MQRTPKTPGRVLIAEDEPEAKSFLHGALADNGYLADEALTASQAMQKAKEFAPDVILLGAAAPKTDGLEICRTLKASPNFKSTAVIFMGKKNSANIKAEALEAGADDFITKPVSKNELIAVIKARLRLKQTTDELRASEAFYRSLIERAPDAFLVFDKASRLLFFNSRCAQILNGAQNSENCPLKEETLKNMPIFDGITSVVKLVNKKNTTVYKTLTGEAAGKKTPFFLEIRGIPTEPSDSDNGYVQVVIRDISDRVNSDKIFARTEKINSLSILTAGIAHEIKNPLTIISNLAQMLKKSPEKASDNLFEAMLSNIERIARIIDDLNFFSKQERVKDGSFELMPVIFETASIMRYQDKKEPLVIQLPHEIKSCFINGSPSQLQQLLVNLLVNAYQAIAADGVVKIQVEQQEDSVLISVIDNGCGIEKAQLDAIFDPFFTTKRNWHGTGLGLAVSHRIVQSLKGTIHAFSEINKGSEFLITLPLAKKPEGKI